MKEAFYLCLLILLLPIAAISAEKKELPYENGVIECTVPDGFICEQKAINQAGSQGLILTSAAGNKIKIELIATAVIDQMLSYFTREDLAKTNLHSMSDFYTEYTVETEIVPVKISKNGFDAFSCDLTDKRSDMPKDEMRYMTIVSAVKDKAMIVAFIHYEKKGIEEIQKGIDIIFKSVIKENKPVTEQ